MNKFFLIAFTALTGLMAQAQTVVTETRAVADFTKIEVHNGIEVIVANGESNTVKVQAGDETMVNSVITESNGNTLNIYLKGNNIKGAKTEEPIKVYVTPAKITGLRASTGAMIKTAGQFKTPGLAVSLASGASFKGYIICDGALKLDALTGANFDGIVLTKSFYGDLRSGSVVKIAGTSSNADIKTTTGATCLAGNFKCTNANVKATRTSSIVINVNETIDANADETASVTYYGNPAQINLGAESYAIKRN